MKKYRYSIKLYPREFSKNRIPYFIEWDSDNLVKDPEQMWYIASTSMNLDSYDKFKSTYSIFEMISHSGFSDSTVLIFNLIDSTSNE